MRWGVAVGGIRIVRAPGEDGSAVDDEVTQTHDPLGDGRPHRADEEQLVGGSAQGLLALALLGGTRHTGPTTLVGGQAAGHSERWPRREPVGHIAVGQTPEHAQEPDQQERFGGIDDRMPAPHPREHRCSLLGRAYGQAAQGEQMQRCDERERIDPDTRPLLDQRSVICWRRDRLRGDARNRNHRTDLLRRGL